jgi:hypothetical protein
LVESQIVILVVVGSSPISHPRTGIAICKKRTSVRFFVPQEQAVLKGPIKMLFGYAAAMPWVWCLSSV